MDKKRIDFAVFCIENVAEYLNLNGAEVYLLLAEKSKILGEYVVAHYDVLHTQGKEYIVNDLVEYIEKERLFETSDYEPPLSNEVITMKANRTLLQRKYASVIAKLSERKGISLREAMDIFYRSYTYQEMRQGVADMHCRSDGYLVEEIRLEGVNNENRQ